MKRSLLKCAAWALCAACVLAACGEAKTVVRSDPAPAAQSAEPAPAAPSAPDETPDAPEAEPVTPASEAAPSE